MVFIEGFILGFSIAAPVGPIGVLCIRRSLANGIWSGFISGLGVATADAVLGAVAAFGLVIISSFLVDNQFIFRLLGGSYLIYIAYKTFLSRPSLAQNTTEAARSKLNDRLADYGSAFVLTITNPMTIIIYGAIFAGFGINFNTSNDYSQASLVVLGVFSGSAVWFTLLSGGVGLLRSRFNYNGLCWVNRFSAVIIAGFGIASVVSLL